MWCGLYACLVSGGSNVVMAIALFLNFLGFIFFFGGFQVQNEHRILEGKTDLPPHTCKANQSKLPR